MGKLFCCCRLGLEEEKRKDNVFVIYWLDFQRKLSILDVVLVKGYVWRNGIGK